MKLRIIFPIILALISNLILTNPAIANKHVPTQAQVDAAKKAEAIKRKISETANKKSFSCIS